MLAGGAETAGAHWTEEGGMGHALLAECVGRRKEGLRLGDDDTEGWKIGNAWRRVLCCKKGMGIRLCASVC